METLSAASWKQYCNATSKESSVKLREWFRESSYMAAEKLTSDVLQTINAPEQAVKTSFDIRLTVLARAADSIGSEPVELNSSAKATILDHPSTYFHLYTIAEPMPIRDPNKTVSVVLRKDVINRGDNPDVKDANFVRKRQILVDCQGKCEETLMAETGGIQSIEFKSNLKTHNSLPEPWKTTIITEGSSSNFFAIYRTPGKEDSFILRTAGLDKVLGGTVRELLLDKYSQTSQSDTSSPHLCLTVCTEPPTVDEIEDWVGCFLTSTSRLVLPISEVILPIDCGSTNKIEHFVECNKDRSWPASELVKVENSNPSSTAVLYRFDPQSEIVQKIATDARMLILAHSETLKVS